MAPGTVTHRFKTHLCVYQWWCSRSRRWILWISMPKLENSNPVDIIVYVDLSLIFLHMNPLKTKEHQIDNIPHGAVNRVWSFLTWCHDVIRPSVRSLGHSLFSHQVVKSFSINATDGHTTIGLFADKNNNNKFYLANIFEIKKKNSLIAWGWGLWQCPLPTPTASVWHAADILYIYRVERVECVERAVFKCL